MMIFVRRHPLATLLIAGLVLRFSLVLLDFSFDVNSYIAWAKEATQYGFSGFYERVSLERYSTAYPNYPPLPIFLFYAMSNIYAFVKEIVWQLNLLIPAFPSKLVFLLEKRIVLASFMKIPAICADIGVAALAYLFAKKLYKGKNSIPYIAASLILFNPAFFYNSALWGQTEALPIFFLMLSFYLLLYSRYFIWSAVFFTLATLSKQTAIIFLPLLQYSPADIPTLDRSIPSYTMYLLYLSIP